MKKYIKKQHWLLAKTVIVSAAIFITGVILWDYSAINVPPKVVYYLRSLNATIADHPKATSELNIQFHKQEHSLSCEAATVKMVLNYFGVNISESEIIKEMPFDKTPKSGNVWGNPNKGFVGNIDGKMGIDGYGIYWGPVAELISKWKKSEIIRNGLTQDLIRHISEGRPVIVWGYIGRGKPMSWLTPEGTKIYAVNGEHTRVVYGYKGSAENPDGFLVMDPVYGPAYWEKSVFLRNWDALGRMGVVVYP